MEKLSLKKITEDVPFFTIKGIKFFSKHSKDLYDRTDPKNRKTADRIKLVWDQTGYWAKNLQFKGFKFEFRNSWNTRAGKGNPGLNRYRNHTWGKVYDPNVGNTHIFFNVGVYLNNENGCHGLLVKLDGNQKKLPWKHYDAIVKYKNKHNIRSLWIKLDEFEELDWDKLFVKTRDYLSKHLNNYYALIDHLATDETRILDKISRICWNTEGWIKPSGPNGKSRTKIGGVEPYESKNGFGHEEWLFDFDKRYGGFHYGFLEPLHKFRKEQTYEGEVFNIYLYTRNFDHKRRYWVAMVKRAEILTKEQSEEVLKYYKQQGWLERMRDQVQKKQGNHIDFGNWLNYKLFNLRFRIENVEFFDGSPVPFDDNENLVKIDRYNLYDKKGEIKLVREEDIVHSDKLTFPRKTGESKKERKKINRKYTDREVEYEDLHSEIQGNLIEYLKKKYSTKKVYKEAETSMATRIDVVREDDDGQYIFYEVKSYNQLKTCIRTALGQLLEYAYWPNNKRARELVIVSYHPSTQNLDSYLKKIQKLFGIPISYEHIPLNKIEPSR